MRFKWLEKTIDISNEIPSCRLPIKFGFEFLFFTFSLFSLFLALIFQSLKNLKEVFNQFIYQRLSCTIVQLSCSYLYSFFSILFSIISLQASIPSIFPLNPPLYRVSATKPVPMQNIERTYVGKFKFDLFLTPPNQHPIHIRGGIAKMETLLYEPPS